MDDKRPQILVVDDVAANLLIMEEMLVHAGYRVWKAQNGRELFRILQDAHPDLFLLDVLLRDETGLDLCRKLKQDPAYLDIPVIFITAKTETQDIVRGFEAGAVDYIAKPYQRVEILARVKTHLRLHQALIEIDRLRQLALDANPLTQLPGNNSIHREIESALENRKNSVVIYCDLDHFKAFNDYYGFASGDEALRFTARILEQSLQAVTPENFFLGNIGGDDFVILAPRERMESLVSAIIKNFDQGIPALYSPRDRERGFITVKNRMEQITQLGIMTISMAGVDLARCPYDHALQVSMACAEMKKMAKKKSGSKFVLDRRRRFPPKKRRLEKNVQAPSV